MLPQFFRLTVLLSLLLPAASRAGQVNWSSAFNATNRYSSGAAMDGQMTFELGVFADGFVPTAANTAHWAAHWRRAAIAFYNVELRYFTGQHPVTSAAAPFTPGTRGYIWGHTGQCAPGEWLLMSAPSWTWPGTSPLDLPVYWTPSSATETVLGQINGSGFLMKTAAATGPLPLTTWAEWRPKMFTAAQLADPAISGDQADPDKDGVVNLAEFALGTHPLLASPPLGRLTPGTVLHDGRPRLTLTVTKRCDRLLTWSATASRDLSTWPPGSVTILSDTAEALTVRENISTPADTRLFLRPVFTLP